MIATDSGANPSSGVNSSISQHTTLFGNVAIASLFERDGAVLHRMLVGHG